jgi:hypothetical protein
MYLNGIMVAPLIQQALFGTGNSFSNFFIGDQPAASRDLNSQIGQLAIYNVAHDQTTHNYIIQDLKEKYRI